MSKHLYVVALDGSEWSERAAKRAIHLAEKSHAKVELLTVLNWPVIHPVIAESVATPPVDKVSEERYVTNKIMAPILEKFAESDVTITTRILWGDPEFEISEYVKTNHAHMLFVGRRGRSRLADLVLGSVANKLAHCVGVPIVLVP